MHAYAYARETLLHFARWMAEHEYPYLEKPEVLEFPTETWPAQDIRKSEVFMYAALHASGAERERFLERADFFFRYSVDTLTADPTQVAGASGDPAARARLATRVGDGQS